MKNYQKLVKAAEIVLTPGRWHKGLFAKTKNGNRCMPSAKNAYTFCAVGACMKVGYATSALSLHDNSPFSPGLSIITFNDLPATTQDEIGLLLLFAAQYVRTYDDHEST